MCLIVNQLKEEEAKGDILVYKIVFQRIKDRHDDVVKSGDKKFKYERGGHYYQTGNEKTNGFRIQKMKVDSDLHLIFDGLHAFTTENKAKSMVKSYTPPKDHKVLIVKMLIPAGAKFYINRKNKEIVANEMIYPPKQWRLTTRTI